MSNKVRRGIMGVRADFDAKAVLEDLGKAFHEFKAENDLALEELKKNGGTDPLLAEKVDKINAEIGNLDTIKAELEKLQTVVARGSYGGGEGSDPAIREHAQAFNNFFRKGVEASNIRDLEIKADLRTNSDPDGGWFVPTEVSKEIDRVAETVSSLRSLATAMPIGTDSYEKLVNMGGAGSGWVEEEDARPKTDTPTLKKIILNTKELYANPGITQKSLDDSRLDIAKWLAGEVVIEFDEQESDAFVNGNGVGKPKGILDYPKVVNSSYAWGKTGFTTSAGASTVADPDAFITLQHALKAKYRTGARFLMSDSTLAAVRKIKQDSEYIWRPGMEQGVPSLIMGKPYSIDDNMPDIAANAYPIAYANFKRAYLILDRFGVRVLRDPYSNKPYVHFYTTKRVGGGIVMYEAIKLMKVAA